jgi:hypothetical protein
MSTNPINYGSVEDGGDLDRSFDVAETYYLKEGNTTPEERRRKFISLMVPILGAVMIVSAAAYFLTNDFSHLYPGAGGDARDYNVDHSHIDASDDAPAASPTTVLVPRGPLLRPTTPVSSPVSKPVSSSTSSSTKKSETTSDSPMCSENPKCHDLGLTGHCCPSLNGDFLSCCPLN